MPHGRHQVAGEQHCWRASGRGHDGPRGGAQSQPAAGLTTVRIPLWCDDPVTTGAGLNAERSTW